MPHPGERQAQRGRIGAHDQVPTRSIGRGVKLQRITRHGPNYLFCSRPRLGRVDGGGGSRPLCAQDIGRTDDRHHPGPAAAGRSRSRHRRRPTATPTPPTVAAPLGARRGRRRRRAGRGRHRLLAGVLVDAGRRRPPGSPAGTTVDMVLSCGGPAAPCSGGVTAPDGTQWIWSTTVDQTIPTNVAVARGHRLARHRRRLGHRHLHRRWTRPSPSSAAWRPPSTPTSADARPGFG